MIGSKLPMWALKTEILADILLLTISMIYPNSNSPVPEVIW